MHNLLAEIIQLDQQDISMNRLLKLVKEYDIDISNLNKNVKPTTRGYLRIPILHDFVQVYVMIWPSGESSSIHEHKNFSGVIKVIEGIIEEHQYQFRSASRELLLLNKKNYKKEDVLTEEENAIHQVINKSSTQRAVTLHIYFPPSSNIAGSRLFDLRKKRIATLSDEAFSFSWNQPPEAFSQIDTANFNLKTH